MQRQTWIATVKYSMHRNKFCLIMVIYYDSYIANMIRTIKKLCRYGDICKVIIVNNNNLRHLDKLLKQKLPNLEVIIINHDNSGWEFGAYQKGLDCLKGIEPRGFRAIIANETLGRHYSFYNQHAKAFFRSIEESSYDNFACGFISYAERRLTIGDLHSSRWLQSNLIGFSYEALDKIGFQLYNPVLASYIIDSESEKQMFAQELGEELPLRLQKWLFCKEGGWYGAEALSKANANFFASKARSILQEMHLSMRLEDKGTALIDYKIHIMERVVIRLKQLYKS